jgi:antitoxin VapB
MGINIKNPAVEEQIRELARLTGKGQTEVVGEAVERMLAREKRRGLAERLMAIAAETAPLFKPPYDTIDHAELLYDEETGLPK